jgi:ENTS family enterobactin (siderophore) exporter
MSIHGLVVTSGPRIGDIEAAAVASLVGPQAAVVSGGILCLLGVVVVARLFPELRNHTIDRPVPEPTVRELSLDSEA